MTWYHGTGMHMIMCIKIGTRYKCIINAIPAPRDANAVILY